MSSLATQEFSEHVGDLFKKIQPDTVVEVGPDNRLSLMARIGNLCGRYVGVTLPEDFVRAQFWFADQERMRDRNIELIAGNAVDLPSLVPKADVIVLHNVLLDLTGNDTELMWEYRRGEREHDEAALKKLQDNFMQAKTASYRGFLEVANPGHILTFHRAERTADFIQGITSVIGVDPSMVTTTPLLYDGGLARDEAWNLVTIDNTSS